MLNKRAVSEVIGALIMITLAVVAGVVVYVYASGLMGPLQGGTVQEPYIEKITLDYYQWSATNLTLILRNTGSAQLKLADFFIAGQQVTPIPFVCPGTNPPSSELNVNAPACTVNLPTVLGNCNAVPDNCGIAYNVRVVTSDGAIFDFSCVAGATS